MMSFWRYSIRIEPSATGSHDGELVGHYMNMIYVVYSNLRVRAF